MKITFDFNCAQDGDCTLLRGVMKGLTSALEDITAEQPEEDAPALEAEQSTDEKTAAEASVEQSKETTEAPVEKPKRTRKKKNTESEAKSEEAGESNLSAVTADPGVQDKPASEEASTDLPFPESEEVATTTEPAPTEEEKPAVEMKQTMTPQDFRAALEDLRRKLGVEPETPESLALARYISTLSNTTYGTAKPSKLPADKLAEFVNTWMYCIVWNEAHDGFEMNQPPF